MSITPKQKLKAIIAKMNASIDALPEDVFSDDLARSQVQEQLSKVNSIVSTPMELVFELYLQVRALPPDTNSSEKPQLILSVIVATSERCYHGCAESGMAKTLERRKIYDGGRDCKGRWR